MSNPYNKITPFKWFVLQNFPFIEEDFDAITEYQLLCKVVEYLNKTIDKTNELGVEVEKLNNWFNNLDVQEEVNNKLNEMTEDGTLAEIINEQIFNGLNERITNNEISIDNLNRLTQEHENKILDLEDEVLNKKSLVVFGDSWSDISVTDSIWSNRVKDVLNLDLYNYAVNGAGFINPSTNLISSQITTFNNSDVDKSKVKYIVLLGGINDYRNNVTSSDLGIAIGSAIETLKTICPNAKILFVSNCEYPYSIEQSIYWIQVHSYLSTYSSISSLNLDGTIGMPLFNNNNYFHLTQNGQLVLARNIVSSLTGGEMLSFRDNRSFEDSDVSIIISTQRIQNQYYVAIKIHVKNEFSQKSISINSPSIPLSSNIDILGAIGRSYNNFVVQYSTSGILISAQNNFVPDNDYYISEIIPII